MHADILSRDLSGIDVILAFFHSYCHELIYLIFLEKDNGIVRSKIGKI